MEPKENIREKSRACQVLFNQCIALPLVEELDWLESWQGAFNLWIASLKATNLGRSSLDYRVRDHEEVRNVLSGLLDGLSESLECIIAAQSDQDETSDTEKSEDSGELSPFLSEDEDSDDDSLSGLKRANSRLFEPMSNVKTIVAQLGRIGTAIRRSGAKYRYRKADESLEDDKFSEFRKYLTVIILSGSISLSQDSPVNAAVFQPNIFDPVRLTIVQRRMIQANVIRRNRIEYATRHMEFITVPVEEDPTENPRLVRELVGPKMGSVTGHSSVVRKETPVINKPLKLDAPRSVAQSQSKTATEIGSQFNFAMEMSKKTTPSAITRVTRTGNTLDYPKCPKQKSDKNLFIKCPYCANSLSGDYSKSHSRWSGHVAQDILPYTCIYEHCGIPDVMYQSSAELLQHIRNEHCVDRWVCDHCTARKRQESFVFETQEDWDTHMKQNHSGSVSSTQLQALARASQRKMAEPTSCPLCAYKGQSMQTSLEDHIFGHIHQFALECLPWGTGEDDKDSKSAGVPVSRTSMDTEEETDVFVDLEFCDTESPDDIPSRLSKMFRSFNEFAARNETTPSSTVVRCNALHDAGDLSPSTIEAISSRMRKVLLFIRQLNWQKSFLSQNLAGDESSGSSNGIELSTETNINRAYQDLIGEEMHLLDHALSQNEPPEVVTLDPSSAELSDFPSVAQFHLAAATGDLTTVLGILRKNIDIRVTDDDHFTALHFAALSGTDDVVQQLIRFGADINKTDVFGRAPLHLAARRGSLSICKLLVHHGSNLNMIDLEHSTPLHLASFHGHHDCVELLLDCGADPNTRTDDLWTPLHLAASTGAFKIVKLLLDRGAHLSTTNQDSWTALHLASESSHHETMSLLLSHHEDVNVLTSDLWTPLHFAVWDRSLRAAELLLLADASVNVFDEDGLAPIHFAIRNGDCEIVELLLQKGASMQGTGETFSSLLHLAAHFGRLEIVQVLLDHKASPSARNSQGQTPWDLAIGHHDEVTELLFVPQKHQEASDSESTMHTYNPEDFLVGLICMSSNEYVAVQCFFDEIYELQFDFASNHNEYSYGRIGKHNVVVSVHSKGNYKMEDYSPVSTFSEGCEMVHNFPNVRCVLTVGIGGGVPSKKHDIRLGDIVVGTPSSSDGGFLQYDYGRSIQGEGFQLSNTAVEPPSLLRAAVAGLKGDYEIKGHRFEENIKNILDQRPSLRKHYRRPDPTTDRLYRKTVVHQVKEVPCETGCGDDPSDLIYRHSRPDYDDNPAIHYGLIASGNQPMKDASLRDEITSQQDILCFDNRAAGSMENFSCLMIRGICDYSDSHPNELWQGYSAMTAAAYAKDILSRINPRMVEALERPMNAVIQTWDISFNSIKARNQVGMNSGPIVNPG